VRVRKEGVAKKKTRVKGEEGTRRTKAERKTNHRRKETSAEKGRAGRRDARKGMAGKNGKAARSQGLKGSVSEAVPDLVGSGLDTAGTGRKGRLISEKRKTLHLTPVSQPQNEVKRGGRGNGLKRGGWRDRPAPGAGEAVH